MARIIMNYPLNAAQQPQSVSMPRRARVLSVGMAEGGPVVFAEVVEDADTRAFDLKHSRTFVVISSGGSVPEGAAFIGSCGTRVGKKMADFHVYEIRGAHPRDF